MIPDRNLLSPSALACRELFEKYSRATPDLFPLATKDCGTHENDSITPVSAEQMHQHDVRMIQLLVAAMKYSQEPTPITINNISNSQSDSAAKVDSQPLSNLNTRRPTIEVVGEMFDTFFSSTFNRVCFFGMCGMGMYVYWSYLDHKWHMAEVQRRIDSNFLLRMTQWMFADTPPAQAPTRGGLMPNLGMFLPSTIGGGRFM